MLALVGALAQELSDVRRLMAVNSVDEVAACRVSHGTWRGKNLLLVQCGAGKRRAQAAIRYVLDHYPVTSIVLVGFAGALKPGTSPGELAACSLVRCGDGYSTAEYACDPALLSALRTYEGPDCQVGVGVTSPGLVASKQSKIALGEASSADVVDMESYWIARMASQNHIPFITIRAVSDTAEESLPELPSWRWTSMAAFVALHPVPIIRLYRNIRRARRSLTRVAEHMIEVAG